MKLATSSPGSQILAIGQTLYFDAYDRTSKTRGRVKDIGRVAYEMALSCPELRSSNRTCIAVVLLNGLLAEKAKQASAEHMAEWGLAMRLRLAGQQHEESR